MCQRQVEYHSSTLQPAAPVISAPLPATQALHMSSTGLAQPCGRVIGAVPGAQTGTPTPAHRTSGGHPAALSPWPVRLPCSRCRLASKLGPHAATPPPPPQSIRREEGGGGGRSGTKKFVYQKWPNSTLPFVNFVFSHCEIWVLGVGWGVQGGVTPLLLWLSAVLSRPAPPKERLVVLGTSCLNHEHQKGTITIVMRASVALQEDIPPSSHTTPYNSANIELPSKVGLHLDCNVTPA